MSICQCADKHCAAHRGWSGCTNEATQTLYRIDRSPKGHNEDSATDFCQPCAEDAMDTGVYSDDDPNEFEQVSRLDCIDESDELIIVPHDGQGSLMIYHRAATCDEAHYYYYPEDFADGVTGAHAAAARWIDEHKHLTCDEMRAAEHQDREEEEEQNDQTSDQFCGHFELTIELENDAFQGGNHFAEISRIIHHAAHRIANNDTDFSLSSNAAQFWTTTTNPKSGSNRTKTPTPPSFCAALLKP